MSQEQTTITIKDFLKKQDELWAVYDKARDNHPKPIKPKGARKKEMQTHAKGSDPNCKYCKPIIEAVAKINDFDLLHLGMTRTELVNTRNTVHFMRRVIIMMKNGGEL